MAIAIPTPAEERAKALADGYAQAVMLRRLRSMTGAVLLVLALLVSGWGAEVDLAKLWANLGNLGSYVGRLLYLDTGKPVWTDPAEWFWGLKSWSGKLVETLLMAYVGTVIGGIGALSLCFVAAGNISPSAGARFATRRFLELLRTVPELVFALLFVAAFGLGPFPGVLAIALHTMGSLGKLFSEVVENVDMKPFEGVTSAGGTWGEAIRFAILPQVAASLVGYGLLRFEINVRGAAIMGFVGAGGIGQDLLEAVQKFYYADVSALLVIIIATVMAIDMATEQLRHRLIGAEHGQ